ncbi:MAG: VWA domain-containing protein [Planctomycetaceae bacterium]|nr:VWA domain-containing protein [Planctomycetaceae bacterium]
MLLEFTHPFALLGLLFLGMPYWTNRWSQTDTSRTQNRLTLLVRSLIVTLLVLSLAGLTLQKSTLEKPAVLPISETQTSDGEANAPRAYLSDLRVNSPVRQGEPCPFDVVVYCHHPTEATLTVFYGATLIAEETRTLQTGENLFRYQFIPDGRRRDFLTATLEVPGNTATGDETIRTLIVAEGPPCLLLLESRSDSMDALVRTLREQGIELEIRGVEGTPQTLEEWDSFDAVVLSDIPATAFSVQQWEMLRAYVRDLGGGLLMLGGENSFAPGGYAQTPLEEILPVSCRFEKEKETPSLALGLVLDRSGSMGGEKLEWAKDAAKSVVEFLTPNDFLTVIAFDGVPHVIVPIQNVTNPENIETAISTIEAAGGTNLYPALSTAYDQLNRVAAKYKHLIVLTDGYGPDADFEGLLRQIANAMITVTTIGIGNANERFLKTIADSGGGRYYPCDDPKTIPQIFLKETVFVSKTSIREEPFVPVVVTPSEFLAGVPFDTAPPLLGFIVTQPKPTSRLLLSTETGEPLLAWGRIGLGICAAWTSDAKNRWAAHWIPWDGFGTFWTQLVRSIMRKTLDRGTEIKITQQDEQVHVQLDAVDDLDRFVNRADGVLNIVTPDFKSEEFLFHQTAPGRYETTFPVEQCGGYLIRISLRSGEKQIALQNRSFMVRDNKKFQRQIAASTGGEHDMKSDRFIWVRVPFYPYLLTLAVVLFVVDLFLRKTLQWSTAK